MATEKPCYDCMRNTVELFFYGPKREYYNSLSPDFRRHLVHNSMCESCRRYFVELMIKNGMLISNE